MCGIIGMVSRTSSGFYEPDLGTFEGMLLCDSLRGMDSTGVFSVERNHQVRMIKHETHPMNLFQTNGWKDFHRRAISDGRILVGHNRKATHGSVSNKNAHPFHNGDIILVHNGTIHGHKTTLKDTDVDSDALCHSIAEKGYKETLKKINGAWALVWYNIAEQKLYLTRNAERPLSIVQTDGHVYFASEMGMMYWLLQREGKKIPQEGARALKAFDLVTISLDPFTIKWENIEDDVSPKASTIFTPPLGDGANECNDCGDDESSCAIVTRPPFRLAADQPKLSKAQEQYPKGSKVIFVPEKIEEAYTDGTTRWRCVGRAYMPGKALIKAKTMLPAHVTEPADAADWLDCGKMSAIVGYHNVVDGVEWCMVRHPTTDIMEEAWGGEELLPDEINSIALTHPCSVCGNPIDKTKIGATSISYYPGTSLLKRVVCHVCVGKNYDEMDQQRREEFKARSNAA